MAERTRARGPQISDLLERIEQLEARLGHYKSATRDAGYSEESSPEELRFCSLPEVPPRVFGPEVSPDRARLIVNSSKKWVNGTKLRYYFFDSGTFAGGNEQKEIVREGFEIWKNVGIGITFEEVRDISEAEVRIGFLRGDGAWSYVGRDVIDIPRQGERTMNFGWDLRQDPRRADVAVHEIGHTLGFPHEHQNPFAGIVWNEDAVYQHFGGPPNNWPRQTTFYNILRKLPPGEHQGSEWDPDSIMHYQFAAGLIDRPVEYRQGLVPNGGLSDIDIEQVRRFYPPIVDTNYPELRPFRSEMLTLGAGEQANFSIRPTASRMYTIQTFGQSDVVMVLFEDQNGDLKYIDGDDDSGTDLNARIRVRLFQGRKYVLRVRMYSSNAAGNTAVMMW